MKTETSNGNSQNFETVSNNRKEEFVVKTFTPSDQTIRYNLTNDINKMCDEFISDHPELEEISREIHYERADVINASFRTSVTIQLGICLYRKRNN